MIRLDQTILGKGEEAIARGEEPGDCIRACVASILERPPSAVPNFVHTGEDPYGLWWWALVGWCIHHGVDLAGGTYGGPWRRRWQILGGPGPRGHKHVVVGFDGEVIHDPHPDHTGLLSIDTRWTFVPLTPEVELVLLKNPPA